MIKIVEKVVLINTGELFDNIVEASKAKGVSYNKVYDSVHHRSKYSWASNGERLIWRFKSEYDNMPKDQIDELLAEVNNLGKIGILLVISGAIGNLIDRVRLGFVVDYLDFHIIWSYVFNLADCFVVVGTILLCLYIITSEEKKDR